jgi:hypothetical protein
MTDDELIGAFTYGLSFLHVDGDSLTDATDPTDMAAMWWLARRLNRRLGDDTPHDLALRRLTVLTAALICGHELRLRRKNLGREWLTARSELLELKLSCN